MIAAGGSDYWKGYVLTSDPGTIEQRLQRTTFRSAGDTHELLFFEQDRAAPSIVVSPGSSGHALVFAELGYLLHRAGYNVFLMPKQGDFPVGALVERHSDALAHVAASFNDRVGMYAEGLGAYVAFYLSLSPQARHPALRSLVLQNGPGVLDEPAFLEAITAGDAGSRRRAKLLPWARRLGRLFPRAKLSISSYLNFAEMVDSKPENHDVEAALIDRYGKDPGFDRRYSLETILSLVSTPPPAPLSALATPTMLIVPERGVTPGYIHQLFERLPAIRKKLVEVDGSVFWMVSHAPEAARLISRWFDETIERGAPVHVAR